MTWLLSNCRPSFQVIVPLGMTGLLLWACRVSAPHMLFWSDEILTHLLLTRSSSLPHLLHAVADGIDSSPPVYWLLMRPWAALAGGSELALRLPSACFISGAFALLWPVLHRRFGFWTALTAATGCFLWGEQVLRFAVEARNYGLFLLATAAAVYQFARITATEHPSRRQLVIHSLLHGVLVLTHLFGFMYSGCLLLAAAVSDGRNRRLRIPVYLSIVAGWLFFLPWLPSFFRQAALAKTGFWAGAPGFDALYTWSTYAFKLPVWKILALTTLVSLLTQGGKKAFAPVAGPPEPAAASPGDEPKSPDLLMTNPLVLAGASFVFLVPVLTWIASVAYKSVWVDRYFFPGIIGWMILIPSGARLMAGEGRKFIPASSSVTRVLQTAGVLLALATVAVSAGDFIKINTARSTRPATHNLPSAMLPVATESSHDFLYWYFYQPQARCYYILDWDSASGSSAPDYVFDYKQMEALHRNFPELPVAYSRDFLAAHDRFLYFNPEGNRAWVNAKLARNPAYVIEDAPPLQRVSRRR